MIFNEKNIVYQNGSIYIFSNDYVTIDNIYLTTNIGSLLSLDILVIYVTKFNNINNISQNDIYSNIILFKKWSNNDIAIFNIDNDLNNDYRTNINNSIIYPKNMITSLNARNNNLIYHPSKLIKSLSNVNYIDFIVENSNI